MSSSLGPAPNPPQSLLPHLDHLLRLLATPAGAGSPDSTETHQAEIASTAAVMRDQLAESSKWTGTLKGGDVAEAEVDEVIKVLSQRVREQRRVLESMQTDDRPLAAKTSGAPLPSAAPHEPQDHEMTPFKAT